MSVSVDITVSCDGKVDGKACRRYMHEDDEVYCKSCAGQDRRARQGRDDTLREWIAENDLSLTPVQREFLDDVCESLSSGRPLALVAS